MIIYGRRVKITNKETFYIKLCHNFDETTPWEKAYHMVKDFVDSKIREELARVKNERRSLSG